MTLHATALAFRSKFECPDWLLGLVVSGGNFNALPTLPGPPLRCPDCHACLASGDAPCAICHAGADVNSSAADYVALPREEAQNRAAHSIPRILAIDLSSRPTVLDQVKQAVVHALHSAADDTDVALMAFGAVPAVFRLSDETSSSTEDVENSVHHADVFIDSSGATTATPNAAHSPSFPNHVHIAPLNRCRGCVQTVVETLKSQRIEPTLSRLKTVIETAVRLTVPFSFRDSVIESRSGQDDPLSFLPDMQPPGRRVAAHLVLVSETVEPGHDNNVPREIEDTEALLDSLVSLAADHGIVIDVISVGGSSSILNALAMNTGGIFMPLATCTSAISSRIHASISRDVASACVMEVHCSGRLKVSRLLGPGMEFSHESEPKDKNVFLVNPPDAQQGLGLLLQTSAKDIKSVSHRSVTVQVVLTWDRKDGTTVWRVLSRRVSPFSDIEESEQFDTSAVLLAKCVATDALGTEAYTNRIQAEILRKIIIAQVQQLATAVGRPVESSRGWFTGPSRHILPAGAVAVASAAYDLHRRALNYSALAFGLRSRNTRESYFSTLLASPYEIALRMCNPELYALMMPIRSDSAKNLQAAAASSYSGPTMEFLRIKPVALALMLSVAAVVDAGCTVFIWISRVAQDQARAIEASRTLARKLACDRQPQADVIEVCEGDQAENEVIGCLSALGYGAGVAAELRKDLPWLAGMPTEDIAAAARRLYATSTAAEGASELSLGSWLNEFSVLLSSA